MTGHSIVVIDDEETIRDACLQALGRNPEYQVATAADGPSGIELVRRVRPQLALVDLKLPGMDGLEILKRIGEADPEVVRIVITGHPTLSNAVEATKRGAYDFLPKPFTPDELRVVVRRGLDKGRLEAETRALWRERQDMQRQFVSLVSHELRAPLNSVEQYLSAVLSGALGEVPARQRVILERIKARVAELRDLVNDWLDLNRIQSGKLASELKPVRFGSLVQEAMDVLRPMAQGKEVLLLSEGWEEDALVLADRRCLKEMLLNLVDNAIKYNKPGGTVTLTLDRPSQDRVALEVRDTGRGIPETELPFLFEEFFRGKAAEGAAVKGTGLGLALVKQVVRLHSGTVEVSSRVGEGTAFTVTLPVADQSRRPS